MAMEAQQQRESLNDSSDVERPKYEKSPLKVKKAMSSKNTSFNSSIEKEEKKSSKKKQKLYCVCRTPYDKAK